ncbi:alpha/beta fold hydrolase [Actinoplanes sp. NPDC023714]|uniref:alpha/beta fold hydrolase n=1 Tax=Actinoplanes sp. NPDC023714 TaxID=3154322 RepID=UPI0033F92131
MSRRTYVLVPGAGGNGWIWHLVAERLRGAGHAVVAVDLPAGDERAGLREYADVIVEAVREAGYAEGAVHKNDTGERNGAGHGNGAGQGSDADQENGAGQGSDAGQKNGAGQGRGAGQENGASHGNGAGQGKGSGERDGAGELVLVAHSMGGLSAPLVCDRLSVNRIFLVNAMIPAPGESGGEWWGNTGQEEARRACDLAEGRDPDGEFDFRVYFFHDVPEELAAYALAHDSPQSGTPFELPWPLAAWPDVPTRVLAGMDDRFFPAAFQERIAKERLGLGVEQLPGGHLMSLSRPAELAEALLS